MIIASDLEGTLTSGYVWKGMGSYLVNHNRGFSYRLFLAPRLPSSLFYKWGLFDEYRYKTSWLDAQLKLFQGVSMEKFQEVSDWVFKEELWPKRFPGIIAEIQELQKQGHEVILVTGAFRLIAEHFAQRIGVSKVISTELDFSDGLFSGRITGQHNLGTEKEKKLREYLQDRTLDQAYGDSVMDLEMLEMSKEPIAVYPDSRLMTIARERGWRIVTD